MAVLPKELPEEDHLPRAVGVHRPQVVVVDLAAVHVLPAHVQDAAVGQDPRGVVVVVVGREHSDVRAVAVAAIERRDAGIPAVDEPSASARAEDDAAVGAVGRLDIVIGSVGELAEAGAIGVDLVEVVGMCATAAIGEEDLLPAVVHLRVADAALGVIEDGLELPCAQVEAAQAAAVAVAPVDAVLELEGPRLVVIVGVVAERHVPMVPPGHADGEDDLLDAGHRPVQEPAQQRAGSVGGLGRGPWPLPASG